MTHGHRVITGHDLRHGLAALGIEAGDHVLVHSSLSSFGRVRGGANTLIDALLGTVGPQGTVMMPAFGSTDAVFDAEKSETTLGAVPRAFWKRAEAVRSRHPLASVAAIGAEADALVRHHEKAATAHGHGTPFHRLYELRGKVLLLGVDQDRSTFLHTAEALARLPYLRPHKARFKDAQGKTRTRTWKFFPGPHRDFIGLQAWLDAEGLTRKLKIGSCMAQAMPCRALLDALLRRLETEPDLFLSANRQMHDGVWQRADILRARWAALSFEMVADSRFAGRCGEEIIDNLARSGLDRVLLSSIGDVPWPGLNQTRRKWVLRGFRDAKVHIAALKVPVLVPREALDLVSEAGAGRLVVPSTACPEAVETVAARGVDVLVENVAVGSESMCRLLDAMQRRKACRNVQLAFNPLGFAQACEHPFLQSFRTPLKRQIGMLFVNDGMATGRRTSLEQGVAEIKELLSVLHCRSFDGMVALQATEPSTFVDTATACMDILEEIGACPRGLST